MQEVTDELDNRPTAGICVDEQDRCRSNVAIIRDSSPESKDKELPAKAAEVDDTEASSRRSSRAVVRPKHLIDYVVEIKTLNKNFESGVIKPVTDTEYTAATHEFSSTKLKLLLAQSVLCELDHRFGSQQRAVYIAAASLTSCNFTMETMEPLVKAAQETGLSIDSEMLSHEIAIARMVLSNDDLPQYCACTSKLAVCASRLHPPSHPNLLLLYRYSMTMALDTAKAERSFSTVKRVLSDYRRSMTHGRLRHLSVLSHEKNILNTIPIDSFLSAFKKGSRRLLI